MEHEYCIVGAGIGGLQLGHYMLQAQRDYVILERDTEVGSNLPSHGRRDREMSLSAQHDGWRTIRLCVVWVVGGEGG